MAIRRRPVAAAASVLLVVVSAAVAAGIYGTAGHKVAVLAVARQVDQGAVISAHDLRVVELSPSAGVAVLPAAMARELVGRHATESLSAGMLLTSVEVGSQPPVAAGDAVVGLALKDGQLPAGGIAPGDTVMVVFTDPAGQALSEVPATAGAGGGQGGGTSSNPSAAVWGLASSGVSSGPGSVLVQDALVIASAALPTGDSSYRELVSIEVPEAVAGTIASSAAAGQVSVVLMPPTTAG